MLLNLHGWSTYTSVSSLCLFIFLYKLKRRQYVVVLNSSLSSCEVKYFVEPHICQRPISLSLFLFCFSSSGGWGKTSLSSPHFHVFSYASCVNLAQLLSQPSASWRVLRIPLAIIAPAVPIGGPRYYPGSASYNSCIRMCEYVDPACPLRVRFGGDSHTERHLSP